LLALGLVVGFLAGALGTGLAGAPATAPSGVPTQLVQAPLTSATFAELAEAVKPAVINVTVKGRAPARGPEDLFGAPWPFGPGPFGRGPNTGPDRPRRGLGSGVIIDASGVALTNAHVVEGAEEVEVTLLDGSRHKAKVVGVDTKTDLAVLRIEGARNFPALRLGNSDEVRVGDWVLAVGSPFGLDATVTSGIVSAKARQIGAGPYDDFLQTDAAINPGNSGGPLVNMRGEVIGINTAIVRGGSGIGFAIPSNLARRVSAELLEKGKVTRGWLGVSLQPLTPELAEAFKVKDRKGALVAEVQPDSPAAQAGLKSGDVIVGFNGKPVANPGELARAVAMTDPGQTARVTIRRDGVEKTLEVRLGEQAGDVERARLGLSVQPVTPPIARELGLDSPEGVVVTRVEEGSPAEDAGLRRGDVIREINRRPIRSLADFEKAAQAVRPGEPITLRVQRGRASLYVALTPSRG
jgi:serine protease Do